MTWAAVAVGASGVVGAATSQKTAGLQSDAAKKASYLSGQAYSQQRSDLMPFMQTGYAGNEMLNAAMGITPKELTYDEMMKMYAPQFTMAVKKKDSGNWTNFKNLTKQASLYQHLSGGLAPKIGSGLNVPALKKFVEQKMAEQKASIERQKASPYYGLLTKQFTNEDFIKDPGYQFRQQQGELGINRGLATRGGYFSGAALKELDRYNQNYASNEFNNAYNRDAAYKSNLYNKLAGLSQGGQQAAQYQGNMGVNAANQYGQNAMAGAQAQGAGYMGAANALSNAVGQGVNIWQNQQYLNGMKNQLKFDGSYNDGMKFLNSDYKVVS